MTSKRDEPFGPTSTQTATPRAEKAKRRLGFLKGEFSVPDDFNEMGREEIEARFYGTENDEPA